MEVLKESRCFLTVLSRQICHPEDYWIHTDLISENNQIQFFKYMQREHKEITES